MNRLLLPLLASAALASLPAPARAETQNCSKITSLPTVITTQGIYCLKQDLATAVTSGFAIEVATNNVTIDCNGYKVGGLAAGIGTSAIGIGSLQRSNITVRNCNVRGFAYGIALAYDGGAAVLPAGNIVEGNRLDGNTQLGIFLGADSSVARDNIVANTGGNDQLQNPIGIWAYGGVDVIGNLVDGLAPIDGDSRPAYGIIIWKNVGGAIERNRVRNLVSPAGYWGILSTIESTGTTLRDNVVSNPAGSTGVAIECLATDNLAIGNTTTGFGSHVVGCTDGGGNANNTVN